MGLKTCCLYLLMSEIELNKYQKGKIYKIWNKNKYGKHIHPNLPTVTIK